MGPYYSQFLCCGEADNRNRRCTSQNLGALLRLPPTIRYDISLVFTDLHLFLFLQRAL